MTQIARLNAAPTLVPSINWSSHQLDTIKRTVAKDTNSEEFDLFIEYCRVKQLDPFSRQAIAMVFNKNDAKKRQMTIITTQEGLRSMAARCNDYRPEETEPTYEYDPALKGPANPLGIVKCSVILWKQDAKTDQWHPVNGTAYWDEYVPIKTDPRAFEWVDTGDVYEDSKKPIRRKQVKEGVDLAKLQVVDDSGQWAKMPRNQIGKCARMQALRGGWPAVFAGVYSEEEMDRARVADLSATEMVELEREQRRAKAAAMVDDEYPVVDDEGVMTFVTAGKFGEILLNLASGYTNVKQLESMRIRNREGIKRFWVKHKGDALEINRELEKIERSLITQGKPVLEVAT
jgi:phage recombination protein Bet